MENQKFEYSVAIRTLGKGGEKYKQELESLHNQTVMPKHIFVFIAEGYPRPEFQVGIEEYVSVHKGLVHQRSASADGVDTEFLLILDDDVFFPADSVEKLHDDMMKRNADGIAPDTFESYKMGLFSKIKYYFATGVTSHQPNEWDIIIKRNGTFSYNVCPERGGVYLTQSAAGTACFMKTDVFRAIHYEHELWIDQYPAGTFGEDQIMFNKIHKNGFRMLMAHDTGVLHLDAATNNIKQKTYEKLKYRALSYYMTWYRTCYDLPDNSRKEKILCSLAYNWRFILGLSTRLVYALLELSPRFFTSFIDGYVTAKKYAHSDEYKKIPSFIVK